jgi:uncharacterized protein (DUF58 family)
VKRATDRVAANPAPLVLTSEGMAWLGVAVVLGGVGWWKSITIVLLLAYLMFGLLLLNGVLARAQVRRVRVAREPAAPVYAGEDAAVRVTATNTGSRAATVSVEDRAGGEPVGWLVNRLAPGASATCRARRTFRSRGRHADAPVVSSAFPFGLLQYDQGTGAGAELVVLPAAGVADADGLRRWLLRFAGGDGRARKVLRRVTADQADVRGVRPYRPGDPIRTIHWRSSARRRALMVREYDAAPAPDLVLVVEPWLLPAPMPAERDALEAALSLAVTVARTWGGVFGTRVVVAVAGDPESVRTATPSDEGVREALTPLAGVRGAASFAPLEAGAFDRSLARAARLLVSSRPNSPYADRLAASTGRRFVAVSPADRLPWYQPPAARGEGRGARGKEESAPAPSPSPLAPRPCPLFPCRPTSCSA